ncbi:hypothetical protein Enr13x_37960 [Stieleria neptunia]|uniref:Competence protein CoiA-like family protein n=1 Tax=Stieleria neptunia TaxID=2527979 RepID=A0A518HSX5_9BACT|nr:hypothetical protein Enr13x_37960 [Stieleria neptunia]
MRFADVDGIKCLPEPGVWGKCLTCGSTVVSHCGTQVIHHWKHKARGECDKWSENVGPWHIAWQDLVRLDSKEVTIGEHRADIIGNNKTVIELQHSNIPVPEIAEREKFYGDMVWVFDATERFKVISTGQRAFFSLGQNKHISTCEKPVFLDFGSMIVEVEIFTETLAKLSGFGRVRTQQWFAEQYLSGVLEDRARPSAGHRSPTIRWSGSHRFDKTKHASRWMINWKPVTIAKNTPCIALNWYTKPVGEPRIYERDQIVNHHPVLANGWSAVELVRMERFTNGRAIILDGLVRVMPAPLEQITVEMSVSAAREHIAHVEEHIQAGRMPVLKDATKAELISRAEQYEVKQYGTPRPRPQKSKDVQARLF